jgi:GTP cyclohydrolase I
MKRNQAMDDIARSSIYPARAMPLDWVGMRGIDLPLAVAMREEIRMIHAQADVAVNLLEESKRGIHMSRLYKVIEGLSQSFVLMRDPLEPRLQEIVASHEECGTDAVQLDLRFNILKRQQSLVTEGQGGWLSYPITIQAGLNRQRFFLSTEIRVTYSSTCPCSAALARQLVEDDFRRDWGSGGSVTYEQAAQWIRENATNATPHSQRSVAKVRIENTGVHPALNLESLIELVEEALRTPVQTAVKRQDEQAFARLNGQNLMYVEDAARGILCHLAEHLQSSAIYVEVEHFESLHPHNAVASSSLSRV